MKNVPRILFACLLVALAFCVSAWAAHAPPGKATSKIEICQKVYANYDVQFSQVSTLQIGATAPVIGYVTNVSQRYESASPRVPEVTGTGEVEMSNYSTFYMNNFRYTDKTSLIQTRWQLKSTWNVRLQPEPVYLGDNLGLTRG